MHAYARFFCGHHIHLHREWQRPVPGDATTEAVVMYVQCLQPHKGSKTLRPEPAESLIMGTSLAHTGPSLLVLTYVNCHNLPMAWAGATNQAAIVLPIKQTHHVCMFSAALHLAAHCH
jgi:hypothetical protein